MKKLLIIAGCTMLLSLSSTAWAAAETLYATERPYVSANLGLATFSDAEATNPNLAPANYDIEADSGIAFSAAVGYEFSSFNTRLDLEVTYQNNPLDQASTAAGAVPLTEDIDSFAVLANVYWDLVNDSPWTPFLSAGLGAALVNVDDSTAYLGDDSDSVFAYQVGAGIGYAVNRNMTVEAKYRYFATADLEFDLVELEYATHNLYAGIRYVF